MFYVAACPSKPSYLAKASPPKIPPKAKKKDPPAPVPANQPMPFPGGPDFWGDNIS